MPTSMLIRLPEEVASRFRSLVPARQVVENFDGDTYRAVYTVKFADVVYVLHCFQKKSTKGIATPKQTIELIKKRLQQAAAIHQAKEQ